MTNSLLSSSFFLILESLFKKMIGIISTLILARLLMPEDFGMVALAMMIIGFVEIFAHTGGTLYLERIEHINDAIINKVFTLNLIAKTAIITLFFFLIPTIDSYYADFSLSQVLYVVSAMALLNAVGNPGIIYLMRQQNYQKIAKLRSLGKLVSALVSIALAFILQSYWALVIGQSVYAVFYFVGSYLIYPFKLRWDIGFTKDQFQFSSWLLLKSILGYTRSEIDTFLVSAKFSGAQLGGYHNLKYISMIPFSEIIIPACQPLLVHLSAMQSERARLHQHILVSFIIMLAISMPMGVGFYLFHEPIVSLVLGSKWLPYAELFGIFGLMIIPITFLHLLNTFAYLVNKPNISVAYEIIFISLIISIFWQVTEPTIIQFAYLKLALELVLASLYMVILFTRYATFTLLWQVITYTGIILLMTIIPLLLSSIVVFEMPLLQILCNGSLFAGTYLILVVGYLRWQRQHPVIAPLYSKVNGLLTKLGNKIGTSSQTV